jgi:hypothetical protein
MHKDGLDILDGVVKIANEFMNNATLDASTKVAGIFFQDALVALDEVATITGILRNDQTKLQKCFFKTTISDVKEGKADREIGRPGRRRLKRFEVANKVCENIRIFD